MRAQIFRVSRIPFFQLRKNSTQIITVLRPVHPSLIAKVPEIQQKFKQLEEEMSNSSSFDAETNKIYTSHEKVLSIYNEYKESLLNLHELKKIVDSNDPDLLEDAESEIQQLIPQINSHAAQLSNKLLPPIPDLDKPCLIEVRQGVGGIEAMIFAKDLMEMYLNFANHMKWSAKVLSVAPNESGNGITAAQLEISHPGSYGILRHEAGIHRVQRIPQTETKGRTHTSTAAVVVLPKSSNANKVKYDDREFKPDEIRIDIKRASGKGGQHVNTTDSAVRLTHFPSGIVISMQDERSQHKNKEKAFKILREKLAEMEKNVTAEKEKKLRTDQVTTTDRSDKIRTYNFVQNRITDHRCGFSLHDIPGCLNGSKLLEISKQLDTMELDRRLKNL